MAHDTHDDGFHEIQLSGKQLVFLFMATTVVSIVIFLCGVLVGRGTPVSAIGDVGEVASSETLGSATGPGTAELEEPPAAPQSNEPTPVPGLTYPERLQGPGAEETMAPVAPPPPPPAPEPEPEPVKAAAPTPPAAAAASSAAKSAPTPAPATNAAAGGFTVQVTALKNRADADAIASRLQGRGYRAYVVAPDAGGQVIYKVRVGMNMARPEAEQVMTRLKAEEKFQPWITR